jgi:uncharacterized membrane protein YfcA
MDLLQMQMIVIFSASVFSSAIGTLVGGSSLVSIPLLILLGLPPHTAIGTDRFGTIGIGAAGLYSFHRQGMVDYRLAFIAGIPCLIGAFIGANLALQISPELLKKCIVALTVILLIVVAANPRLGVAVAKRPITPGRYVLGVFLSLLVGIYGGFYGGGAATFLSYTMILVFRQTFLESAANLKIGAIMVSISAAATYAYHGAINFPLALAMFAGSCIGSYISAHYSSRIGNVWIKRLFIGIILIMAMKLLVDA